MAVSGRPMAGRGDAAALAGVAGCFLLSGFAALLYQTAWLRQFSLVFGTSELAIAAVLATYMAGLALGAAVASRCLHRVTRPVRTYALLEAGIGASALAVPALLAGAGALYALLLGDRPELPAATGLGQSAYYLTAGFLVLVVPTALMGATLPLLIRYAVKYETEIGPRTSMLYAVNTAGAVAGALVAAFVLLPALGLAGTVRIGVATNALVFVLAAWLAGRHSGAAGGQGVPADASPPGFVNACLRPLIAGSGTLRDRLAAALFRQPAWILPLIAVSGANAFLYEVLWTRLLTHVLGGSVQAFATMLAAFLTGIALGSAAAARFARHRREAAVAFAIAQAATAVAAIGVYAWMQPLVPDGRSTGVLVGYAAGVMLPATLFIGASFPLAVRIASPGAGAAGAAAARVYAYNTAGAIAGAVGAAYFVIPAFGFRGAVELGVCVSLAVACWALVGIVGTRRLTGAAAVSAAIAIVVLHAPGRPDALIAETAFDVPSEGESQEVYYGVGRTAAVYMAERNGQFELRTNGLPEAAVLVAGAPVIGRTQHWLVGLGVVARPEARSMLMVGLGGGVALENVPVGLREIDVVELEPRVIEANRSIAGRRAIDPLADDRIRFVVNDARNALALTRKRYDLIVSQPSHPWTAGASHLYTREFAGLARARLAEDGVFVQWMSRSFVDAELLRSLAATLNSVFANVRLYRVGVNALYFLASDAPLELERSVLRSGRPLSGNVLYYGYMGLNGVNDLVAALALDEDGVAALAAGAAPSTDDRNLMAMRSRTRSDGIAPAALAELLAPHDPLLDPHNRLHSDVGESLRPGYIATRLLAEGLFERAAAFETTLSDASDRALVAALRFARDGQADRVEDALRTALESGQGNAAARFALLERELPAFARGEASDEAAALARTLPPSASAVLTGWRLAAAGDWQALAGLDRELARADPADLWFPHALQLRANWRVEVVEDQDYWFDARRLVDRALAVRPNLDLFMLRASAVDKLGDRAGFVETSRYAAEFIGAALDRHVQGQLPLSDDEILLMSLRLEGLSAELSDLARASVERAGAVNRRIAALLGRMRRDLQP